MKQFCPKVAGRAAFALCATAIALAAPVAVIALHPEPALAQEASSASRTPAPWPEVRPKRLAPPSSGTSRRITVQIRPAPVDTSRDENVASVAFGAAVAAPEDLQDWFWDAVPHDLVGAAPERFGAALSALDSAGGEGLSKPTFQQVTDIANAYGRDILLHSIGTEVSPALALAVIAVESSGRTEAQSAAGAQGLMQLMPDTAARFGVTDPDIPAQNIRGGITYLDWLIKEFRGDVVLALAGYNAGENAIKDHKGPPPYAETRAYVPKVLAAWQVARGLCLTPPDLYSDGCVFATNAVTSAN